MFFVRRNNGRRSLAKLILTACCLISLSHCDAGNDSSGVRTVPTYQFELLGGGQVIARDDPKTGFPSVIRVPDWVPVEQRAHPRAKYYLYYGSHHGDHIMMKWTESLDGEWEEFNLGGRSNAYTRRGVFDTRSDSQRETYGHVAAPDVHVDHEQRRFIMFYHGENQPATRTPHGTPVPQLHENFVAFSKDGLNFNSPVSGGGEPGYGPQTVTVDGVTRDVWTGPVYQRAFQVRGEWYSLSKRALLSKARNSHAPFEANPEDPFGNSWIPATRPTPLWLTDAREQQPSFYSAAAAFLASSEFADHPENPHPGVRVLSHKERLNHLSVCLLPDNLLEIFFYIRFDLADRYNAIYRIVYDVSDPDFENWDVVRDTNGQVVFDVVLTPEEVYHAVRAIHPNFKPMYHADPVSLGSTGVFVDNSGEKSLFFAYVSEKFSGEEGEGQIAAVRLLPKATIRIKDAPSRAGSQAVAPVSKN